MLQTHVLFVPPGSWDKMGQNWDKLGLFGRFRVFDVLFELSEA